MPLPAHAVPETATWLVAGVTENAYHDLVADWGDAEETEIRIWIEQQSTAEHLDGRDTVVSRWLILTNELGIGARDRIRYAGDIYELDGAPSIEHTPSGPHHLEAVIKLVSG